MEIFEKHVFVCTSGKTCSLEGGEEICSLLRKEVVEGGLKGKVRINKAGCMDRCDEGPVLVVYPEAVWYQYVDTDDIEEIIQEHLVNGRIVERLKI